MTGTQQVTYAVSFGARSKRRHENAAAISTTQDSIPRIARLLALAIRIEGLVREQTVPDYAAVARRGRVTRARMTQVMKLLNLAPDIQEEILFLPSRSGLTERTLRPIVQQIDWDRQRGLFRELLCVGDAAKPHAHARGPR